MTSDLKLKPSDVLAKAADLIEPEGAWGHGWLARDATGKRIGVTSSRAVCFCLEGAVKRVGRGRVLEARWNYVASYVHRALGHVWAACSWNDDPGRTQAEVVAALRKASTLARSEGC